MLADELPNGRLVGSNADRRSHEDRVERFDGSIGRILTEVDRRGLVPRIPECRDDSVTDLFGLSCTCSEAQ